MSSAGTDAEQQLCSGFGFYLQVGGAARKSPERGESAGSVHVEREKTVCEREREKPLLELCVCSIRKLLETEPGHRGRSVFNLLKSLKVPV